MSHLYLVDGSGFIFRAYHALPPLSTREGIPTNAVSGFATMLLKLIEGSEADYLAVVFDTARKTFRNDIYPAYKAHRPPPPEDLVPQFPLIREAVRAMSVACVEMEGFEADDLIATYTAQARARGIDVTIVSSDKDLMQLVGDGVRLWDGMKNRFINSAEVYEKFGVTPDKVVEVQALAGDSTDNVPGVPGIGIKTAAALIEEYGDLETLLSQAGNVKQAKRRENLLSYAESARVSRRLVTLKADVPVEQTLESFTRRAFEAEPLLAFFEKLELRRLAAQVKTKLEKGVVRGSSDAGPEEVRSRYECVQSLDVLQWWVSEARKAGIVAVDTETDALNLQSARMVGFSLALMPGKACYVPLRHGLGEKDASQGDLLDQSSPTIPQQIPVSEALSVLASLLVDPSVLKVGQNIKFDMHVFAREGIAIVAPFDDTMVMSYALDGASQRHGLDYLAKRYLAYTCISYEDVCGSGKTAVSFDQVALDKATAYAAEDADITLRLHQIFRQRLLQERMNTVYGTLDRPLVPLLCLMEAQGIKVDGIALKGLSEDFAIRMADLEAKAHSLAGEAFNLGSPKQLSDILFVRMGLQGVRKSAKTKAWSTDADVLEGLSAQGYDLPTCVLAWRQCQKLKSTYADALLRDMDSQGRVHTTFSQTVTTTGRLSSSEPNLQNIPIRTEEGRKIRSAFVAEAGHLLISADYSQIELRLIAHVADIQALKEAFHQGEDIHAITASAVFGVPLKGMDPMIRRRAKAINFGIIYGISPYGLSQQLGIPPDEAKGFIDAYFERFPEVCAYMDTVKAEARTFGFVKTFLGRKCFVPDILDKNASRRAAAERAAINAPIQGGAADILKRAMIRLPGVLEEAGLASARMLLQVHDELLFEVPAVDVEATCSVIKETMESVVTLSVPLVVETGVARTWAEAH